MRDKALWQAYANGDESARERLLAEHLTLVRYVARRVHRKFASEIELDELVSAGMMGLMEALERFEPSRGLSFSTYAVPRIRGAIVDELRRIDHVPSWLRRRARAIATTKAGLSNRLGRTPTNTETAHQLGVAIQKLWRWEVDAEFTTRAALDNTAYSDHAPVHCLADILASTDGVPIDEQITMGQEVAFLCRAIQRLTRQERTVLTLYYFEELRLNEIAQVIGVTESRISQIRSQAITKLRAKLAPLRATVA